MIKEGKDMTIHDLLNNGLVKDDDKIKVVRPLVGNILDVRTGYWFNDQILDFHNAEITEFSWSKEKGWLVAVEPIEAEPADLPFC